MRPSRARTLQLAAAGAFAVLAVRPIEPLERGLDWLALPVRGLGELARPIAWFQSDDIRAGVSAERSAELEEQARLEDEMYRMARPRDRGLPQGQVPTLRAEVVERPDGHLDRLLIRVEDPSVVHADLPVVSGNVYVGRLDIAATRDDSNLPADLFFVQLVTGARFRIGARMLQSSCRMVVGGLAALPGTRLAVHNPSDRSRRHGRVVVDEPHLADGRGDLANGFRLGELVEEASDPELPLQRLPGLVPEIDYATGLHQVLVLLPEDSPEPIARELRPLAEDGRWLPARLLVRGEISPKREGIPLALGRLDGVRTGAAMASGTRFAGRVLRAGVVQSDVGLLGDPGLTVSALAMIETGRGRRAQVLGQLECLGRDGALVRVRWPARTPLDPAEFPEGQVSARVWTGSGEALVPRGLLLGDAILPVGPGPHEFDLQLPEGQVGLQGLSVRMGLEGSH